MAYSSTLSSQALRRRKTGVAFGLAGMLLVLVAGCDTTVHPLVPSDRFYYSIFGVLNPAADTQWVRVEPLADSVQVGAPPEIDATVTLKNLGTGRVVALRDSFMRIGFGDVYVHNFWTTNPITPGATYRLRVMRSDGATSSATVTIPDGPPAVTVRQTVSLPCDLEGRISPKINPFTNRFIVTVREAAHLAGIHVYYPVSGRVFEFSHFSEAERNDNSFVIPVVYARDLVDVAHLVGVPCTMCCPPIDLFDRSYVMVVAAAGGPGWPALGDPPLEEITRPDTLSNVTHGHGLLGGIYTADTVRVPVRRRAL